MTKMLLRDVAPDFGQDEPEPDPNRHDWIEYLQWGVANEGWDTSDLLFVIEKPWKTRPEYALFLERDDR